MTWGMCMAALVRYTRTDTVHASVRLMANQPRNRNLLQSHFVLFVLTALPKPTCFWLNGQTFMSITYFFFAQDPKHISPNQLNNIYWIWLTINKCKRNIHRGNFQIKIIYSIACKINKTNDKCFPFINYPITKLMWSYYIYIFL